MTRTKQQQQQAAIDQGHENIRRSIESQRETRRQRTLRGHRELGWWVLAMMVIFIVLKVFV